jgi:hypothetical protein
MKLVKPGLNLSPVILLGTVLILAAGCSESVQQGQQQSGSDNNAAAMTAAKAPAAPAKPKQNQGVVKSVEVAGGYTYALVDVGGDEFWLATAVTEVQPGAEVAWRDYAMMKNFKSKSLNREFDQILFDRRGVDGSGGLQFHPCSGKRQECMAGGACHPDRGRSIDTMEWWRTDA